MLHLSCKHEAYVQSKPARGVHDAMVTERMKRAVSQCAYEILVSLLLPQVTFVGIDAAQACVFGI